MKRLLDKIPTGVLTGVVLAAILWLTLAPHPTGRIHLPLFHGADKIAHGILFFALTTALLLDVMKKLSWRPISLPGIGLVAFITSLVGVGIEILQRRMGLGRSLEALDMIADAGGAFLAAGIWAVLQYMWAVPKS